MNAQQYVQRSTDLISHQANVFPKNIAANQQKARQKARQKTRQKTRESPPTAHFFANRLASKELAPEELVPEELVPEESLFNLFKALPISGLWISSDSPGVGRRQQAYYAEEADRFSMETVEYLVSERWLTGQLASALMARKHISLDLESLDQTLSQPYFFAYGSKEIALDELADQDVVLEANTVANTGLEGYWLVWAQEPLTQIHKYCIEQQMQYFRMKQHSQQVRAQLCQQVRSLKNNLLRVEHQLRTPLSLIELCADILQKSIPAQPLKDQAQFIGKTVDDMTLSLQRLTQWDEAVASNRVRCNLKQVVSETIGSLKIPLEQNQITIASETGSVMLTLDVWKIKQAFSNLFSNAIAFSPTGGIISCHWHVFQREVLLEICDQGSGFSPEDLAKLYTPFYSRRPNGTGLGMIIAKDIISAHQGRLWVANQPTGGAVISVVLPRL